MVELLELDEDDLYHFFVVEPHGAVALLNGEPFLLEEHADGKWVCLTHRDKTSDCKWYSALHVRDLTGNIGNALFTPEELAALIASGKYKVE